MLALAIRINKKEADHKRLSWMEAVAEIRLTHLLQSAALEEEDARGRATGINALDLNPSLKKYRKTKKKRKKGRATVRMELKKK